jgi:hypothetical protein
MEKSLLRVVNEGASLREKVRVMDEVNKLGREKRCSKRQGNFH